MDSISQTLWMYDDPRIADFKAGRMSLADFATASRTSDPWQVVTRRDGTMAVVAWSPAQLELSARIRAVRWRAQVAKTGGLTGNLVWDNRGAFLVAYPEIGPMIDQFEARVGQSGCRRCAINSCARELLGAILAAGHQGRDLSALEPVLPPLAMARLRGEVVLSDSIPVPPPRRRALPLVTKEK